MDLDELRSAQSRERQASQLQHLRDGFYEEAASFIRGLRTERERATANSEYSYPYDDPEVQRLTNEIQTAEEVVESLYERRVGKVVKMASFDAAGMAVDAEGLTAEESDLFETLVSDIETNRARVLDALAGTAGGDGSPDAGGGSGSPTATETGTETASSTADPAHEGAAPEEEGPVHIGSGPAADGPVSTADEQSRETGAPPEQAPTPGTEHREAAAPESAAPESSQETPPRDAAPARDTPARDGQQERDAMDAASAMGGSATDDSSADAVPGQPGDARGDVPTGQPSETDTSAPGDSARTADAAAATGTGTAEESGHQPVLPADGPSGTDPQADTGTETRASTPPKPARDEGSTGAGAAPDTSAPTPGTTPPGTDASDGAASAGTETGSDADGDSASTATPAAGAAAESGTNGTLVRITGDVGEIFGVDGRAYDLSADDVAVLPADNAELLVTDGDAERLDSAVPFSGGHSNRS